MLLGVRRARVTEGPFASDPTYGYNGVFQFTFDGVELRCIVSDQKGWDHVSVSVANEDRCPTWAEMCHVKELFWSPEEAVIQYHPRKSEYVNNHPNVLHLWRPQNDPIPEPPAEMVGAKGIEPDQIEMIRYGERGVMVGVRDDG